ASSRAAAKTPSSTAKSTRDQIGGLGWPPDASMSTTSEPESDEVMKKIAITMMAMTESTDPSGRPPRMSKSVSSAMRLPSSPSMGLMSVSFITYLKRLAPPMMENQTTPTVKGTSMTAVMNSRTVRPREIRAMKTPTNGAQAIHQPQ